MFNVADFWSHVQRSLFPYLAECLPPRATARLREFILTLEVVHLERHVPGPGGQGVGRPGYDRRPLARAFLAKAFYNFPTTEALWERLQWDEALRQVCGWERRKQVPSVPTFTRAFAEFATTSLLDRAHTALVAEYGEGTLFWHVSRDSTPIEARERPLRAAAAPAPPAPAPVAAADAPPAPAPVAAADAPPAPAPVAAADAPPAPAKRRRGRPRKGEASPPPEPTRLERQYATPLSETAALLAELPKRCDIGCKKDAKGHVHTWQGYKLHVDVGDTGLPLLAVTTSASLHDSQVAIPMLRLTAQRVTSLYDLMDSAYDAEPIWNTCYDLGHFPIIDENPRRGGKLPPREPDRARQYCHRSASERFNSDLKDNHGGRTLRVRGVAKVHTHLLFGTLVIFAKVVLGWVT
jgi:hypothetical protein